MQEISCKKNDLSCMETLCPYGWIYIEGLHKCKLQEGFYLSSLISGENNFEIFLGFRCCNNAEFVCGENPNIWCYNTSRYISKYR